MIRILLADDQRLMCDGLRSMLETEPDLSVVGMASDGGDAVRQASQLHPDLILLDIRMPVMDGVEATRRLREADPRIKIVVLTTFDDEDYIMQAMACGADGYLLKDMDAAELIQAVRDTAAGRLVMPARVAENLKRGIARTLDVRKAHAFLKDAGFNAREIEIARLLAEGFNHSQIATALFLSNGTVRNYVSSIYEKLETPDKSKAIVRLKEMGL